MTNEEKAAILAEARATLGRGDETVPRPRDNFNVVRYIEPTVTRADVESIVAEAIDGALERGQQMIESAIEQERQSSGEFVKAVNELANAAGDAIERIRKDITELQAVMKRYEDRERKRFDDVLPYRLQAH
jgi:ABC-type transporter Mla subunit MlaD